MAIEWDDRAVVAKLNEVARQASNLNSLLAEIGESLVESTKQRFANGVAPDGSEWKANSVVTIAHKGRNMPLVDGGFLHESISYNVGENLLKVGSSMEYAAMQQFGGTQSDFPHLWGDIPARPFLGISSADEEMILTTVDSYLFGFI